MVYERRRASDLTHTQRLRRLEAIMAERDPDSGPFGTVGADQAGDWFEYQRYVLAELKELRKDAREAITKLEALGTRLAVAESKLEELTGVKEQVVELNSKFLVIGAVSGILFSGLVAWLFKK